jgi:DNA-binding transcriptional LysR family regulator
MLDVRDLHCFVTVYEVSGFGRAARRLNTVQSNVSARIRRLELLVGAPLFERLHRSIRPTPKGELLYRYAKPVLANLAEIEEALKDQDAA